MNFHSSDGEHFLGVRTNRRGETEVVYDNAGRRRVIFRLEGQPPANDALERALRQSVESDNVLGALRASLVAQNIDFDLAD